MKRILFAVLLLLGGDATAVVFDDGQLHVIDAANSFPLESVFILDGPAQATTAVTIVDGGVVGLAGSLGFRPFSSALTGYGGGGGRPKRGPFGAVGRQADCT
jgi:hypothetical protein